MLYKFKAEFCKMLDIPNYQIDRRQDDLLEWLTNFYDFTFIKGSPSLIDVHEQIGEYQPLPRKNPSQTELTAQKKEDYKNFTIASLTPEFQPNSQSKIARDAINAFGYEKYGHINQEAVTKRYIKEPFKEYGESDNHKLWVWYTTYQPLNNDEAEEWRKILHEEKIGEAEAANAFYRQEQGEDISKEKGFYKKAQERFKEKYGDIAVLVQSWKLKV